MNKLVPLTCLVFVLIAGCAERQIDTETSHAELSDFVKEYEVAFSSADTAAIRTLYAADNRFSWLEDGTVRYRSRNDIVDAIAEFPSDAAVETTLISPTFLLLGPDHATISGQFESRFDLVSYSFDLHGAVSMVVERSGDGWHIVAGHTSSLKEREPSE